MFLLNKDDETRKDLKSIRHKTFRPLETWREEEMGFLVCDVVTLPTVESINRTAKEE